MKKYRSIYAGTMDGLIAAINCVTKEDNSKCIGWQQTENVIHELCYEAIMEQKTSKPPTSDLAQIVQDTEKRTDSTAQGLKSEPPADQDPRERFGWDTTPTDPANEPLLSTGEMCSTLELSSCEEDEQWGTSSVGSTIIEEIARDLSNPSAEPDFLDQLAEGTTTCKSQDEFDKEHGHD